MAPAIALNGLPLGNFDDLSGQPSLVRLRVRVCVQRLADTRAAPPARLRIHAPTATNVLDRHESYGAAFVTQYRSEGV